MQAEPRYDDVVDEVLDAPGRRRASEAASRRRHRVLDRSRHRVRQDRTTTTGRCSRALDRLRRHRHARWLVGTSRKGFLGAAIGAADGADRPDAVDDRLEGSVTTAVWAATMGAAMIRVHDVRRHRAAALRRPAARALLLAGSR